MYMVWRGIGATGPWFSIPYFLLLVAVGHFFVLNVSRATAPPPAAALRGRI